MKRTIYIGTFIYTPMPKNLSIAHNTVIGVDETGRIAFITNESTNTELDLHSIAEKHGWIPGSSYEVFRPPTHVSSSSRKHSTRKTTQLTTFFAPGFIDTHTHASQYPNTGLFGSSTLLAWLEKYTFPLESSFKSPARARRIYPRVVTRGLANGTTTAAYYATVHVPATKLLADVCLAAGQRALIGRVCMDRMTPDHYRDEGPEEAVQKTQEIIDYCAAIDPEGDIVRPVITPRFAPSCSNACLTGLGALHKATGTFVQTHVSENVLEVKLVQELFPESKNYVSVYADFGLLSEKTILAHAVHLTTDEVDLVASHRAGISHCPVSNSSLTSGACRVRDLWDAGINVSLGTDMSGGYSPSILEVARQALLVSRHVAVEVSKERGGDLKAGERYTLSIEEAIYLATRGGAAVVGLGDRVGAFEVGMEWDAQLICLAHVPEGEADNCVGIDGEEDTLNTQLMDEEEEVIRDLGPVDLFSWEPWPDIVAKWVYNGDDRNVGAVWVKGRLVHSRGEIFGF